MYPSFLHAETPFYHLIHLVGKTISLHIAGAFDICHIYVNSSLVGADFDDMTLFDGIFHVYCPLQVLICPVKPLQFQLRCSLEFSNHFAFRECQLSVSAPLGLFLG